MAKKPQEPNKPKKIKLVRDSFCMPKDEYAAIDVLKTRAMGLSVSVKKSELLRAGLVALSRMSDAVFHKTLAAVPTIKTGRPSADKAEQAPTPVETQPVKASAAPMAPKARVKADSEPAAKASVKRSPQPARKAATKAAPKPRADANTTPVTPPAQAA